MQQEPFPLNRDHPPSPTRWSCSESRAAPSDDPVTHVLCGARAYELGTAPLYLTANGRAERSPGTHSVARVVGNGATATVTSENDARLRLNGLPLEMRGAAATGDEITIEGAPAVYYAICVVPPDAP